MKVCYVLAAFTLSVSQAGAQATPTDTTFRLGRCAGSDTSGAVWKAVVDEPDEPAHVIRTTIPKPPKAFSNMEGVFVGRVVLAAIVDTTGEVVPGSITIAESTESRLSQWACTAALELRFVAAKQEGKLVRAVVQQPLTYALSPVAPTPIIRGKVVEGRVVIRRP